MAQIHVADELTSADFGIVPNNTLHSDGTSKKGYGYQTYDIRMKDGTALVAGLRSVGAGDSQTQLDTFKEVIGDLEKSLGENGNGFFKKGFYSIKNLMSDRCNAQKRFNELFTDFRSSVLPDIISNWNDLSLEEQEKFKIVNDFYCGLHFLVALGDQAEGALKVWENHLIEDMKKVGSLNHGGYSRGDSGTLCPIKEVCKSVSERGCEKSGRMVSFATFFKGKFNSNDIPLFPFLGNRFNIIFLNGAGVFQLYSKLLSFFVR